MATASVRLAGVGDPPLKLRCAVTRLLVSRPDAASPSLFVARRRTVNEPAAVKVAVTGDPLAGAAPPSKFQRSPSPVPLPEKLPACPASRLVGALVIVPVGSVTVTGTVCEVIRPPGQPGNGWKALAGMVVPFSVTARLFGSKVQLASTATLTVPLVTTAPSLGVGPMKRSGLGFGSPHAAGGCARIAPRTRTTGTAFLNPLIHSPPAIRRVVFFCVVDLSQTLAPAVNGGCIVTRDPQRSGSRTGLVDCGNWGVSAAWSVPPTATSAIYIPQLVP